jgi:hypothetical protein
MGDINCTSVGWPPAPGPRMAVGSFTLATRHDERLEVFALGGCSGYLEHLLLKNGMQ